MTTKDIDVFEEHIEKGFPFNDFLYCIQWQKDTDGHLQGCMQLCKRNRRTRIRTVPQSKDIQLTPADTWEEAEACMSPTAGRITYG